MSVRSGPERWQLGIDPDHCRRTGAGYLLHPDDVVGQGRDLLDVRETPSCRFSACLLAMVLFIGSLAIDAALAGAGRHRLLDQFPLVETITDA